METYIATKVKDALAATNGDRHDAQKLLITWAIRDPDLLLGLCKPHLKAIVAAQIEHAAVANKNTPTPPLEKKDSFSANDVDDIIAMAKKSSPRLSEDKRSPLPPPQSSVRQATVMQQLAEAYRKQKQSGSE